MSRCKLLRYRQNLTFPCLIQADPHNYQHHEYLRGAWSQHFGNHNPLVLELGCGRAEHSIYGALYYPSVNWIAIDIKGDRLHQAVSQIQLHQLSNVACLRVNIHNLHLRFAPGEVAEILIPYPDPRPRDRDQKRRLTSTRFLTMYHHMLAEGGYLRCKTDDEGLYTSSLDNLQSGGRTISTRSNVGYLPEFVDIVSQFSISKGAPRAILAYKH